MEADDLLCSRNARSRTPLVGRAQWKINQPPSLEKQRASVEGAFISFDARSQGQPRPLPLGAKWGKMKRMGGWPVALLCSRNAHRGRPIRPPVMAKLGIRKDWADKGTVDCVIQSIALLHIHTNIRIIQASGPVRITCAARQKRRRRMQGRKPGKPKDVFAKYGKTGFRPSATQMVADRVRSRTVNVGQAPR
jgi:hypothetical protein